GITGIGNVLASGGTLELLSAIGSAAGPTFQVANGVSNVLQIDGTVGSGNTFAFLGAAGELRLNNDKGFNSTVSGLNAIANSKSNFVHIVGHTVTINSVSGQGTKSGTITLSDGAVLQLSNLNTPNWSANTVGDGSNG